MDPSDPQLFLCVLPKLKNMPPKKEKEKTPETSHKMEEKPTFVANSEVRSEQIPMVEPTAHQLKGEF